MTLLWLCLSEAVVLLCCVTTLGERVPQQCVYFVDIMAVTISSQNLALFAAHSECIHHSFGILLHHVPIVQPSKHCYPQLLCMSHGHSHDTWPLSCCFAIAMLSCLCQAALPVSCFFGCISRLAFVIQLCNCFVILCCHAALLRLFCTGIVMPP